MTTPTRRRPPSCDLLNKKHDWREQQVHTPSTRRNRSARAGGARSAELRATRSPSSPEPPPAAPAVASGPDCEAYSRANLRPGSSVTRSGGLPAVADSPARSRVSGLHLEHEHGSLLERIVTRWAPTRAGAARTYSQFATRRSHGRSRSAPLSRFSDLSKTRRAGAWVNPRGGDARRRRCRNGCPADASRLAGLHY